MHKLKPYDMIKQSDKLEFGALKYSYVIASQCAQWRGNPHPVTRPDDENAKRRTDCHTSDIGHWFAMTIFVMVRCNSPNFNLTKGSRV